MTGGQVLVEIDPVKAADQMEEIILERRKGLNI